MILTVHHLSCKAGIKNCFQVAYFFPGWHSFTFNWTFLILKMVDINSNLMTGFSYLVKNVDPPPISAPITK